MAVEVQYSTLLTLSFNVTWVLTRFSTHTCHVSLVRGVTSKIRHVQRQSYYTVYTDGLKRTLKIKILLKIFWYESVAERTNLWHVQNNARKIFSRTLLVYFLSAHFSPDLPCHENTELVFGSRSLGSACNVSNFIVKTLNTHWIWWGQHLTSSDKSDSRQTLK